MARHGVTVLSESSPGHDGHVRALWHPHPCARSWRRLGTCAVVASPGRASRAGPPPLKRVRSGRLSASRLCGGGLVLSMSVSGTCMPVVFTMRQGHLQVAATVRDGAVVPVGVAVATGTGITVDVVSVGARSQSQSLLVLWSRSAYSLRSPSPRVQCRFAWVTGGRGRTILLCVIVASACV